MSTNEELAPEIPAAPEPPRISVIIVSCSRAASLRRGLEALGDRHHVVVVDNGSRDGAASLETEFPHVRFMRLPKNFGLTRALNIGLRAAEGEYLLCLHDDTQISGDAVTKLADYLEAHSDVGMVAPLLLDPAGKPAVQVSPLPTPSAPYPQFAPASGGAAITAECVSGVAIMFRAFFLRALRQIEERYGNYGSDIELAAQMKRAAKKVVVLRDVTAIHENAASPMDESGLEGDRIAGTAAFLSKHHGFMSGLTYRLTTGLGALLTFRMNVASGALSGQKIDGN